MCSYPPPPPTFPQSLSWPLASGLRLGDIRKTNASQREALCWGRGDWIGGGDTRRVWKSDMLNWRSCGPSRQRQPWVRNTAFKPREAFEGLQMDEVPQGEMIQPQGAPMFKKWMKRRRQPKPMIFSGFRSPNTLGPTLTCALGTVPAPSRFRWSWASK